MGFILFQLDRLIFHGESFMAGKVVYHWERWWGEHTYV
jgi:hypothetical protein